MLSVKNFFKDNLQRLDLKLLNSEVGFPKRINKSEILRPGLILSGFTQFIESDCLVLFNQSETAYLTKLLNENKLDVVKSLFQFSPPCMIFTKHSVVPEKFIEIANDHQVCLFHSELHSTELTHVITDQFHFLFAPRESIHATLMDIYGIGTLFVGKSGIGKSEIALDLVERGHRLVADDLVITIRKSDRVLLGEGRSLQDHHLEIRGLGLIDVKRLYGIKSVRKIKRIEIGVELEHWVDGKNYDRTGLEEHYKTINNVKLPFVNLPIHPGKNITVLSETIALNHLAKINGYNPAQEFNERLIQAMAKKNKEKKEYIDFLDEDYE